MLVVSLTAKVGQELKAKNRKIYHEKEHTKLFKTFEVAALGSFLRSGLEKMTAN